MISQSTCCQAAWDSTTGGCAGGGGRLLAQPLTASSSARVQVQSKEQWFTVVPRQAWDC